MNRRKFIKNGILSTAALAIGTGVYTWKIEPFWLEFTNRIMPIKNLPEHLKGATLMQISDIHVGNRFDYQYIIESFQKAQQFQPDIVVYTGDYVSYENHKQLSQLQEVLQHAVKGKIATVGILGNHDYGGNWSEQHVADDVTSILEKNGIQVLSNRTKDVEGLQITGLDDYWGLNFNPDTILKQINHKNANVVLCHNPDVCDLKIWNAYDSWILSGHTHGGQCKPPFLKAPLLPVKNKRYDQGEIALEEGRTLYINRALGHLHQVRFNVRPEITIFTLEKA